MSLCSRETVEESVARRRELARQAFISKAVESTPAPRDLSDVPCYFSVENLSVKFKKAQALKNINFSVKQGEVVLVIGKSGSGKSTLLEILENDKKSRTISKSKKISGRIQVGSTLYRLGKGNFLSKNFTLSNIILWDEKEGQSQGMLGETARERSTLTNTTFLIAAHKYVPSIFNCADKLLFMESGELLWCGTPQEAWFQYNGQDLPEPMMEYIHEYKRVYGWDTDITDAALSRPAKPFVFNK